MRIQVEIKEDTDDGKMAADLLRKVPHRTAEAITVSVCEFAKAYGLNDAPGEEIKRLLNVYRLTKNSNITVLPKQT